MATSDTIMANNLACLSLEDLPVEILIKVFAELDLKHAMRLARTTKRLGEVFRQHTLHILLPILEQEFSPLPSLLRIPELCPEECESSVNTCYKRRIFFAGYLVVDEDVPGLLPEIRFRQEHAPRVMEIVRFVSEWESAFPRLRFAELAEGRRTLEPHEKERFRGALYNWWRYTGFFDQIHEYIDATVPWTGGHEMQDYLVNNLRNLTTAQLYELRDLWQTVRYAVEADICPTVLMIMRLWGDGMTEDHAESRGWASDPENAVVVASVLKLAPYHLLDMLNRPEGFGTRDSVINFVLDHRPPTDRGITTLGSTLREVVHERVRLIEEEAGEDGLKQVEILARHGFPERQGGIVDFENPLFEHIRSQYNDDGGKGLAEYEEDDDEPSDETSGAGSD